MVEYYTATTTTTTKELLIHVTTWVNLKIIVLSMLKDKLGSFTFLRRSFEQTLIPMVKSAPPVRVRGRVL